MKEDAIIEPGDIVRIQFIDYNQHDWVHNGMSPTIGQTFTVIYEPHPRHWYYPGEPYRRILLSNNYYYSLRCLEFVTSTNKYPLKYAT